jgi:hypothetical protein
MQNVKREWHSDWKIETQSKFGRAARGNDATFILKSLLNTQKNCVIDSTAFRVRFSLQNVRRRYFCQSLATKTNEHHNRQHTLNAAAQDFL